MVYYVTSPDGGYYVDDTATWGLTTSSATTSTGNYWGESWMGETSTAGAYMQAALVQQQCINTMMSQQAVGCDRNGNHYVSGLSQPQVVRLGPTPDDVAATNARAELARAAGKKAEELLLSHLTAEQRETFVKGRWFVVKGKHTKYRINGRTYAGNIEILEGDKVVARLCCHCRADIPLHDHLLAQKIMLESAEDDFIKLANRRAA